MNDDLWQLGACEIAQGIREKRFSCEQVVAAVSARIAALNPRLNAVVADYSDEALLEARTADRKIAEGEAVGPLHGVPVTIKSNIDVAGKPTPNGLPAFKDLIAPADSPVVSNLKKPALSLSGAPTRPSCRCASPPIIRYTGAPSTPGMKTPAPGVLPVGHQLPQLPVLAPSTTATTSVARCAARHRIAACPRLSPPSAGCPLTCQRPQSSAACWRN